ncbi:MAG: peptide deformylase [Rhodobacteraceae bacterium]|nr:peptide deformylase [Paracoccaceae bacterium]
MSVRAVLAWPDARLSQVCAPVGEVTGDIRALASDMLETLYAAQGRGLAAPQVGVLSRLFVIDMTWKEGTAAPLVCIDPVLTPRPGALVAGTEECLSIRGAPAEVLRAPAIDLEWTGVDGRRTSGTFGGMTARCIQHEMDHLDGLVIFDRLDPDARALAEAAYAA